MKLPGYIQNRDRYKALNYLIQKMSEIGIDRQTAGTCITAAFHYLADEKKSRGIEWVEKIISYQEPPNLNRNHSHMLHRKSL